jgi:hypothetical protein
MCAAAAVLMGAGGALADDLPVTISDYPRVIKRDTPRIQPGQEMRLGIFRLHPSFQTTVEHDDNIRLSESDKEEDVVFTQLPGLATRVKLGDHRATAGYWAEVINFADNPEENAVNHIANAELNLDLGRLTVQVTELMEDSTSRLFNEESARDQTLLNAVGVTARYERPKWVFEGGYRNNLVDHKPAFSDLNDRRENIVSVLAGRKFATKTTLFVEGNGGQVNYDSNVSSADHDYWQAFAGLNYRDTFEKVNDESGDVERSSRAKLTATARVGYQNRQLSDVAGRAAGSDFDEMVADASLTYKPSISEAVNFGYTRTAQVSTFGPSEWHQADKVSFSWKKRLTRKLYVIPRAGWRRHDYPEEHTLSGFTGRREDDLWQFQGELRYEPRSDETTGAAWAWASLFYTFRSRESNFDTLEFDNNRVGVKVGFSY